MAAIFGRDEGPRKVIKLLGNLDRFRDDDDEEKKDDDADNYNFYINGTHHRYEEKSLFCLDPKNKLRLLAVQIFLHPYFEGFIMFIIVANAILFAQADYSHVDSTNALVSEGSLRNTALAATNLPFLVIFTIECLLKSVGMGVFGKYGYLADPWSWLDLIVVFTGWLDMGFGSSLPNISALRALRVLRVLRGLKLKSMPGLKQLITCIVKAIVMLTDTAIFTAFILTFFAILGVNVFAGPYMHARCRLTPYPVNLNYSTGTMSNYEDYRCIDAPNFNIPDDEPEWGKSDSPWKTPQDCYWPVAPATGPYNRYCSLLESGFNQCYHDTDRLNETEWTWCGSDYDALGNTRFTYMDPLDEFLYDYNYGYTIFDHFGYSLLSVYDAVCGAGWSYQTMLAMDAFDDTFAVFFFVLIVMLLSFVVVQLFLAVLTDSFLIEKEAQERKKQEESSSPTASSKRSGKNAASDDLNDASSKSGKDPLFERIKALTGYKYFSKLYLQLQKEPKPANMSSWRLGARKIVVNQYFNAVSTGMIIINAIVLMTDHYPAQNEFTLAIDYINMALTIFFAIEMALILSSYGISFYLKDSFNLFDGIIIIACIVALIANPPSTSGDAGSGGAVSALRLLRILRLFRLMTRFKSLRAMIRMIFLIFSELGNFLILFFIFIFICTLISLQFFANVQRYDANGFVITEILSPEWVNAPEHARYSFDDFNSAFATVFQIVTTENWTNVLNNLWRAQGSLAIIFPCFVVGFGHFIMSNIFLGLMLTIFDAVKEKESQRKAALEQGLQFKDDDDDEDENGADEEGGSGCGGQSSARDDVASTKSRRGPIQDNIRREEADAMKDAGGSDFETVLQILAQEQAAGGLVQASRGMEKQPQNKPPRGLFLPEKFVDNEQDTTVDFAIAWKLVTSPGCLEDKERAKSIRKELGISCAEELVYCDRDNIVSLAECLIVESRPYFYRKVGHVEVLHSKRGVDIIPPPPREMQSLGGVTDLAGAWEILNRPAALSTAADCFEAFLDELGLSSVDDLMKCSDQDLLDLASYLKPVPHVIFLEKVGMGGGFVDGYIRRGPAEFSTAKSPVAPSVNGSSNDDGVYCGGCNLQFRDFSEYLGHECPGKSLRTYRPTMALTEFSGRQVRNNGVFAPLANILERSRIWLFMFFEGEAYTWIMLTLIAVSSITLAMDSPMFDPSSTYMFSLQTIDAIMTASFALEMACKIFTYGFLYPRETAYIRDTWNQFDGFIVVTSIISLFADYSPLLAKVKVIRAIRALRPLRMLRRIPGLAALMTAVIASIPDVLNVLGIVLFIMSLFSIIAVTYLKGDMRSCQGSHYNNVISQNSTYVQLLTYPVAWSDMTYQQQLLFGPNSTVADMSSCTANWPSEPCCIPASIAPTSKQICHCWNGAWDAVIYRTFDNYPQALLGFFQIATLDSWIDVMWAAVDSAGAEMQPRRDNNQGYIYFFVAFIVIANYFALNLFIGVLITNVKQTHKKMGRGHSADLTVEQEEWVSTQEIVGHLKPHRMPRRPEGIIRGYCFDVCSNSLFGKFILFCIFLNTVILAMDAFGQSDLMEQFIRTSNGALSVIFTLEAIMKLIWLRREYFSNPWNILDLVLIAVYDVLMFASLFIASHRVDIAARVFSIMRMVKVLDKTPRSKDILNALGYALPQLMNIVLLLSLLVYIFAVVGVQLFAKLAFYQSYEARANFRTFPLALLTLFRFATMDNWSQFMYDASKHQEGCLNDPPYDPDYCGFNSQPGCLPLNGCGSIYMFPYLIVFVWVLSLCMFNLFLGVVIESFVFANDRGKIVKNKDFRRFAKHWAKYDPDAACYMSYSDMFDFVLTLFPPLGFAGEDIDELVIKKRIAHLHLPLHFGGTKVHFRDVLSGLTTAAYMKYNSTKVRKSFIDKHEQAILQSLEIKTGKKRRKSNIAMDIFGRVITSRQMFAAMVIQRCYRSYLSYKKSMERINGLRADVLHINGVLSESQFFVVDDSSSSSNSGGVSDEEEENKGSHHHHHHPHRLPHSKQSSSGKKKKNKKSGQGEDCNDLVSYFAKAFRFDWARKNAASNNASYWGNSSNSNNRATTDPRDRYGAASRNRKKKNSSDSSEDSSDAIEWGVWGSSRGHPDHENDYHRSSCRRQSGGTEYPDDRIKYSLSPKTGDELSERSTSRDGTRGDGGKNKTKKKKSSKTTKQKKIHKASGASSASALPSTRTTEDPKARLDTSRRAGYYNSSSSSSRKSGWGFSSVLQAVGNVIPWGIGSSGGEGEGGEDPIPKPTPAVGGAEVVGEGGRWEASPMTRTDRRGGGGGGGATGGYSSSSDVVPEDAPPRHLRDARRVADVPGGGTGGDGSSPSKNKKKKVQPEKGTKRLMDREYQI